MRYFTLWSCIDRGRLEYRGIPASSAVCKSEFENIKKVLLDRESLPIRLDDFLKLHVEKYITGHMNIFGSRHKRIATRDISISADEKESFPNVSAVEELFLSVSQSFESSKEVTGTDGQTLDVVDDVIVQGDIPLKND